MSERIPTRMDFVTTDGTQHIMDIGQGSTITVIIKGPFVDLTLENVRSLEIYSNG